MEKKTPIMVLNRDDCAVVYSIPEMNGLRRVFQPGETKQITYEELEKLSYIPGGRPLLEGSLVILNSPEAISLLLGHVQPEYSYSKDDVIRLMQQGSLDEFLDCLDFAPEGVKELIKNLSVELPLNDVAKREAVLNKLGFNVDRAISIKKEIAEPTQETAPATRRRVSTKNDSSEGKVTRRIIK